MDINNDIDNIKDVECNKENNKNNVNTNDVLKKNSDYIIKTKDQIFAIDSNEKDIINGITSKKNINIINNDT